MFRAMLSTRRQVLPRFLRKRLGTALLCTCAIAPAPSMAWDGTVRGVIATIEVSQNINNFPFRVWLGGPALCTGGPAWAYLDGNGSNYKAFVAALLSAQARGTPVTLYTLIDSGSNFCRIEHIAL